MQTDHWRCYTPTIHFSTNQKRPQKKKNMWNEKQNGKTVGGGIDVHRVHKTLGTPALSMTD